VRPVLLLRIWMSNQRRTQSHDRIDQSAGGFLCAILIGTEPDTVLEIFEEVRLEEAERVLILATLKKTSWVVSGPRGAAARLGLNRSTLQFRMKKLGIERPSISTEASVT
jgi:transcriptional regulator with GAF, ATPase, and Fis domain